MLFETFSAKDMRRGLQNDGGNCEENRKRRRSSLGKGESYSGAQATHLMELQEAVLTHRHR